jgi:hypothetical protein
MANLSVLRTIGTTLISSLNLVDTVCISTERITKNSLGMLEDISSDGRDFTSMSKATHMADRRQNFTENHPELKQTKALKSLLEMEL